jgi:hypothetical protein
MAHEFQEFAGTPYPELSCFSCHGSDAEQVAYRMPHGLPPLDPGHLPTPSDPDARRARFAKFMIEEVTPLLGELLDAPGVSCNTCHPLPGSG